MNGKPNPAPRPTRAGIGISGSRFLAHPDVKLSTTKLVLRPENLNRVAVYLTNNDSTIHMRLGGIEITTSTGVQLRAASPTPLRLTTTGEIWAIAESGTPTISVTEELI